MSNFKIYNLFPLSIYRSKIDLENSEKDKLKNLILNMEKKSQNKDYKSINKSWTGDTQGYESLHYDNNFTKLFEIIGIHIKSYLESLNIDLKKIDIFFQRSWPTISRGAENISPHIHAQSHISFAYYLRKSKDDAKIIFLDQNKNNEIIPGLFSSKSVIKEKILKKRDEINTSAITFDVNENDIVIFPSKTLHSTQANVKNNERISLSADVTILAKNSKNLEHLTPAFENWKKI